MKFEFQINEGGSIVVRPAEYPTITKESLERDGGGHFHFTTCRLAVGPRGGYSTITTLYRSNGALKTWKTRPTEFRLPLKRGLRDYGELTHSNASLFHRECDCPLMQIPPTREEVVKAIEGQMKMQFAEIAHYELWPVEFGGEKGETHEQGTQT